MVATSHYCGTMQSSRRPPKWPLDHDPSAVFDARDSAGLTQQELADQCGVSRSLIAEIELGTRNARPDLIRRLAEALSCSSTTLERKREPVAPEAIQTANGPVPEVRKPERADQEDVSELQGASVEREAS
jgi:transcriptional regulator with XRE-family HTH domain